MSAPPKKVASKAKTENDNNNNKQSSSSAGRKMNEYLQRTLTVTLSDGRLLVGRFVAYDPHMNIVLNSAFEYPKGSQPAIVASGKAVPNKREVGLVIVRGENVVNITAVKKTKKVEPKVTGAGGSAAAVPGSAVAKTSEPNLPKASGARRKREEDE